MIDLISKKSISLKVLDSTQTIYSHLNTMHLYSVLLSSAINKRLNDTT